jgi:hypothetical protein
MNTLITKNEARKLLKNEWSGKFFSVVFIKRTDGTIRKMNCRTGVQKGTLKQELKFIPEQKDLKSVYDIKKKDFRFISLDNIKQIKMNKINYKVI